VDSLGNRSTLHVVEDADHSFRVGAKEAEALDAMADWMLRLVQ
jgi:dipeptidyl aminopeptidase/acylaminoacyl peptidase